MFPGDTRIEVIVPAYNPGPLLRRALRSVVAQTYTAWQCVVIDDGGTEDLSWVNTFDDRVRLIRQSNRGTSAARNAGLAATSCELVAFLDQDDEWLPSKLERQVPIFADPAVALCDSKFAIVRDGVKVLDGYNEHHGTYHGLFTGGAMGLSTVMARREAVLVAGGFNPCLRIWQDHDLYLRITMLGWTAVRVEDVLAQYHLHDANASRDFRLTKAEYAVMTAEHDLRARTRGDADTVRAIRTGAKRTSKVVAAQAYDAFRANRRSADLNLAMRLDCRATSRGITRWVLQRLRVWKRSLFARLGA
jgi:glycosyltransferase involved in cell wall biosynthesis